MKISVGRTAAVVAALAAVLAGWPGPVRAQHERDHEELRRMARTITDAVNGGRFDELTPLLAKDFSLTMVDQTVVTEPGQIKEYFRRYFQAPDAILKSVRIQPEADILTHFLDDVTGVNRGGSTDTYTLKDGRQVVFHTRWTGTFRKYDDQWKVVTLHVGVNFLDNPILTATRVERWVWGGAGLVTGLLVAGGAGWLVFRRLRARA
jgi:hypothetical protein